MDIGAPQHLQKFAQAPLSRSGEVTIRSRDIRSIVGFKAEGFQLSTPLIQQLPFDITCWRYDADPVARSKSSRLDYVHVRRLSQTCGLTRFGGRSPLSAAMRLSAAIMHILSLVSCEALAMCGARMTFSIANNSGSISGSLSNTSSPAPAIFPSLTARTRAFSSTTGPREVLMTMQVGFMSANVRSLSRW